MRRGGNGSWIWLLFLLFFIPSGGGFFLFIILAIVIGVAIASIQSSKTHDNQNQGYRRTGTYRRTDTGTSNAEKTAKINIYLRKYFRSREIFTLSTGVTLRVHGDSYASLASLDVYRNNQYLCSMNDFARRYPESYTQVINELAESASQPLEDEDVIDATVTPTAERKEAPKAEPSPTTSQGYINMINSLNTNITDPEITNGLYETSSLLTQIHNLEEKMPNSKSKLTKLYEYYLPILVKILKQYETLQDAKTDPTYNETCEKLKRTISLINEAMKKIISSMTDQDFINLSADISTLEAVLKKDGLTEDGQMKTSGGYHE